MEEDIRITQHQAAANVYKATQDLNEAMKEAVAEGLEVRIE